MNPPIEILKTAALAITGAALSAKVLSPPIDSEHLDHSKASQNRQNCACSVAWQPKPRATKSEPITVSEALESDPSGEGGAINQE